MLLLYLHDTLILFFQKDGLLNKCLWNCHPVGKIPSHKPSTQRKTIDTGFGKLVWLNAWLLSRLYFLKGTIIPYPCEGIWDYYCTFSIHTSWLVAERLLKSTCEVPMSWFLKALSDLVFRSFSSFTYFCPLSKLNYNFVFYKTDKRPINGWGSFLK